MERIGVVSPEQMHAMWQDYLTRQQLAPKIRYNFPDRRPVEDVSPHRVKVKNDSGEIIPAFACMRITGVEDIGGQTCIKVEKPTSTDGEFLFNSQFAIAVPATGELGVGWAYRHGVVTMLGDEPTEPGASFGPVVGSWEIEEGGDKFVVFGRHDFSERALVGRFNGGTGGGHTIWFQITDVLCPETDYVDETTLIVTATYYNLGCNKTPPGANYDGSYEVFDICSYLSGIDAESLVGTVGRASYMYPLDSSYCEPRWIIDDICASTHC